MLKKIKQVLTDDPTRQKPLRLWPGVAIVVLQWLVWLVVPIVIPEDIGITIGVFGGMLGGLVIVIWWAFFSRAPRAERWGAVALMIIALVGTFMILHESIATAMMGLMFFAYAIPVLSLAFVVWVVASRGLSERSRRATMVMTILLACGIWVLFRSDGLARGASAEFAWRWSETHEEWLLAQASDEPMELPSVPEKAETDIIWPGFRGSDRDGIIRGVRIETDWSASGPWRPPLHPGAAR
jgi:hypothetical protein